MKSKITSPIEKAIQLAGGVSNLAKACGVSKQAAYKWRWKGYPSFDMCDAISRAVGDGVTRIELVMSIPPAGVAPALRYRTPAPAKEPA